MNQITLFNIQGVNPPLTIYICDVYGNDCVEVAQIISSIPPSLVLQVPSIFDNSAAVGVKIVTEDGCERLETVLCEIIASQTPTNTITPTQTPTQTVTNTETPTQTVTNSETPTQTVTNTETPTQKIGRAHV